MNKEHRTHFSPNTRLTQARLARGWSQEDVASLIGTEGNTVNRWERGRARPRPYFRQKLCDLFGKSALELGLIALPQESPETSVSVAPLLESQTPALFWCVPHLRNPFFTGREEILERLHNALSTGGDSAFSQVYALHGLGGVGKTQVALEYAYRHAQNYRAVFWIDAETSDCILGSLIHIAECLHLPESKDTDQHRIVSAIHQWLMTQSQWLLIWDNVENLELLSRYLPPARQGAILLTTRRQALGTLAHSINLPPMAQEEGTQFVLQRARILAGSPTQGQWDHDMQLLTAEQTRASELVQMMEGLPLALDQAGAYMEETQCTLEEYLSRYKRQQTRFLERRGESNQNHPASVATTLSLSFQQVAQKSPAAADLLRVCALLSPDVIPEELIRQGAIHLGATLQAIALDSWLLDEAIATLGTYSLIRRNQNTKTLSIHRLVQAVLLSTMTTEEHACWLQRIITALGAAFPTGEYYATWEQDERLISHTLWCLAQAGSDEETLELSGLAYKAAVYLGDHGRSAEAEPLLQQAIRIQESAEGADHQLVLSLTELGFLYLGQGKHALAEPLFRRAIHLREQVGALDYPQNGAPPDHSLQGLAILFREQGKYADAEPLFRQILCLREAALGPEHVQVAYALGSLAVLSQRTGKYREAEHQYLRAISIWEQTLGSEHPSTVEARVGLAYLYYALGRYEEMESLLQQALHFWEQTLGPDHPQVFYPLIGLARLSSIQGQETQAELQYQRAIRIQEQALKPDDPRAGYLLEDLALFRHHQNNATEAQQLYYRALSFWQQSLGPDHPQVAHVLYGLANVLRDQGEYPEAERLYQRCLSIRERTFGLFHLETAETLFDFARCRQAQGHLLAAVALSQQALVIREQILGPDHPETVKNQEQYNSLLERRKSILETLVEVQSEVKMRE